MVNYAHVRLREVATRLYINGFIRSGFRLNFLCRKSPIEPVHISATDVLSALLWLLIDKNNRMFGKCLTLSNSPMIAVQIR